MYILYISMYSMYILYILISLCTAFKFTLQIILQHTIIFKIFTHTLMRQNVHDVYCVAK